VDTPGLGHRLCVRGQTLSQAILSRQVSVGRLASISPPRFDHLQLLSYLQEERDRGSPTAKRGGDLGRLESDGSSSSVVPKISSRAGAEIRVPSRRAPTQQGLHRRLELRIGVVLGMNSRTPRSFSSCSSILPTEGKALRARTMRFLCWSWGRTNILTG